MNIDYYYPGYVVPGYHRFDYKLKIGEVEFYDPTSQMNGSLMNQLSGRTSVSPAY